MFNAKQRHAMARVINAQRLAVPVVSDSFRIEWDTVLSVAVEMGKLFTADDERFDAESWFTTCGYGKDPVQRAVSLCGQLTHADREALREALTR